MNLGRSLVSMYIFPIYSPITPILNNCMPPNRYMGKTEEAQPGTALSLKILTHKAQIERIIVALNISNPRIAINLRGNDVNEVTPFKASETIFRNGYLDLPANLSLRS